MKVLHVVPGLASRTGGPAVSAVESSVAVRECGVEAAILAPDAADAPWSKSRRRVTAAELPAGAESLDVRLFPTRTPWRLRFSPGLYRALGRHCRAFDVVHIHSLFLFPQWAAYHQAAQAGVPYIVSPRGALDPYLRRRGRLRKAATDRLWQNAMFERAAALHLTSDEEARLVADIAPSVPRAVVPNGIHWERFQQLPARADFRARRLGGFAGPVVLNLGRISYKKGLEVLIRAFALVRQRVGDARLVIAGPDDEGLQPRLVEVARNEGVGAEVIFVGMVSGREKLAALAAADVWALSSYTENFGIAVVEALACGLPSVISPAVNLAPEIERE
ncbi:MAG: glycosyltransferase, partial [Actinobacteria bacterium]|nr:glycosyltransferase [Actinomycetota bacterium]